VKPRLAACLLAVALASLPGCVFHQQVPIDDVRQLLASPYRYMVHATRRDGVALTLHPPVVLSGDTLFGWHRPQRQDGLLRVGVPLAELRTLRARGGVNWPATLLVNGIVVASLGGLLTLAVICEHQGGCGPIEFDRY